MRLLHRAPGTSILVPRDPAELDDLRRGGGWLWLDFERAGPADIRFLAEHFRLADGVIEDLLEHTVIAKLDEYDDYLFIVGHSPAVDTQRLRSVELDAILGEGWLITLRRESLPGVDSVWERAVDGDEIAAESPDACLALVLEGVGRRVLSIIDNLEAEIERLEDLAIAGDPNVIGLLQPMRRDVIVLRRVMAPQRDVAQALEREGLGFVGERGRRMFAGVHDDHRRLVESLESARGLLGTVVDTYRSTVAERMNEVMKVLTVFAAIVLPLGLIAGIYGMNFANMPELGTRNGYFIVLGVMAVFGISLWVYFARRGFIGGPKLPRVDRALGKGLAGLITITTAPVRGVASLLLDDED